MDKLKDKHLREAVSLVSRALVHIEAAQSMQERVRPEISKLHGTMADDIRSFLLRYTSFGGE